MTQKSSERLLQFEKQAKTSVSQLKYPVEVRGQADTRNYGSQNSLQNSRTENKREGTLASALENVQRLNEEIKNQSNELKKSTSYV